MSEDDLTIWERLLGQSRAFGKTFFGSGDVVDDIAGRLPVIGPEYEVILLPPDWR